MIPFINSFQNLHLFMPNEYKVLKVIVDKLATSNDLGDYPITFSINAGSRIYWSAKHLGLCDKESYCGYFRQINPFKEYKGKSSIEINEAINVMTIVPTIAFPMPPADISSPGGSGSKIKVPQLI